MAAAEKHPCAGQVYDGRFDTYSCARNGKYPTDDGKWWCGHHHPDKVAAKNAAKRAEQDEKTARRDESARVIEALLRELGVQGGPQRRIWEKTDEPYRGAFVSISELQALVARLKETI